MEYEAIFTVQVSKKLTDSEKQRLAEALIKAMDSGTVKLPFEADVFSPVIR